MAIKAKTLELNPEFFGKVICVSLEERPPRQVFGNAGSYQRYLVMSENHGFFHVVIPASSNVIEKNVELEIIEPVLYEDSGVNGTDVAPSLNVFAKGIKKVGGK